MCRRKTSEWNGGVESDRHCVEGDWDNGFGKRRVNGGKGREGRVEKVGEGFSTRKEFDVLDR